MGVLPTDFYNNTISSNDLSSSSSEPPMLYDYLIDLNTGYLVVSDSGRFSVVYGLKAIVMQMWRKLHTKKGVFSIYSNNYGNLLDALKGKGKSFADTYAQTILSDAVIDGIYVTGISDFKTQLKNSLYTMSFTINTIYGNTSEILEIPLED